MITYIITTHPDVTGARLSRSGDWGNQPHSSVTAAETAARIDAGRHPFTITHERAKPRR